MNDIAMTLSSPEVTLVEGKGSLTVSVTNASTASQRIVLGAFPVATVDASATNAGVPAVAQIANVDRPLRTVAAGATEQYAVSFDVSASAPGDHGVRLIGYSADRAPEEYADQAQTVTLTVAAKHVSVPVKKFPWWIVIGGAVILVTVAIAGVVFVVTRPEPIPTLTMQTPDILAPETFTIVGRGTVVTFSTTAPDTDDQGRPYLLRVVVSPSDTTAESQNVDTTLAEIPTERLAGTTSLARSEVDGRTQIDFLLRGSGVVSIELEAPNGTIATWRQEF